VTFFGLGRKPVIRHRNFKHQPSGIWMNEPRRVSTRLAGTVAPALGVESIE
jgi:hypothetical protein